MSARTELIEGLLAQQATEELAATESERLEALLSERPDIDRDAFERAAATVFLAACADVREPMPRRLSADLLAGGQAVTERRGKE